MTPSHAPGSGEIAERIRKAWLAANPEPATTHERRVWEKLSARLETMLDCQAYESAVIQFLVPNGWAWTLYSDASCEIGKVPDSGCLMSAELITDADTPAEALLATIEETSRDR